MFINKDSVANLGSLDIFKLLCIENSTDLKNRNRVSSISWHLMNTDVMSSI